MRGNCPAVLALVFGHGLRHNKVMAAVVNVSIHNSQSPEKVRRDLLESLRTRRVNHKFHYDSVKQTHKWLALHQAFSPSRKDVDCTRVYNQAFAAAAARIQFRRVHVVGLGCGGGQKDTRLLALLKSRRKEVSYTPCDVSTAMVLVARETASPVVPEKNCAPLVCDLASTDDLPEVLNGLSEPGASRLVTFFGMIPNFEPEIILPRLASVIRPRDRLLFSANLAPGADYGAGVKKILPQYNNALTRDWLMTFLLDLGVERDDGKLQFHIESNPSSLGLKRVAADFQFTGRRVVQVEDRRFEFRPGQAIRLFFSYRYTPALVEKLLREHGLTVLEQWITKSEEEGVFLVGK